LRHDYLNPTRLSHFFSAFTLYNQYFRPTLHYKHFERFNNVEILLLTGDDDQIVKTSDTARMAKKLAEIRKTSSKRFRFELIESCGHLAAEEQPDILVERVVSFLLANKNATL
jgi:pimeloyl-ACP methyl ester carboxylesterase